MMPADEFLSDIFRGTYLPWAERAEWVEEMRDHLEEAQRQAHGLSEEEAYRQALAAFGSVREIRQHIIRETIGISPRWLVVGCLGSWFGCLVALLVNLRFDDWNALTHRPVPTPAIVLWLHSVFPLNPMGWVLLAVVCGMLLWARKPADRWAVLASGLPYLPRILPFAWAISLARAPSPVLVTGLRVLPSISVDAVGQLLLVSALSGLFYVWTHNRAVGVTPWVIAIAAEAEAFSWNTFQILGWSLTHLPLFWGAGPWSSWGAAYSLAGLMVYVVGLWGCRRIFRQRGASPWYTHTA